MNDQSNGDEEMPAEIDFSQGIRGLHHIPPGSKIKLLSDILRGDTATDESLK